MALKLNPITSKFDLVTDKASEISVVDSGAYYAGTNVETVLQEVGNTLSTITNPLLFKGSIAVAADFPTLAAVQTGWFYKITANVTDNNATKTNTGLSFLATDDIAWDGSSWISLGSSAYVLKAGDTMTGNLNISTAGQTYLSLESSFVVGTTTLNGITIKDKTSGLASVLFGRDDTTKVSGIVGRLLATDALVLFGVINSADEWVSTFASNSGIVLGNPSAGSDTASGRAIQVVYGATQRFGVDGLTGNISTIGSLGATGARVVKGWFTDLEVTNMPTINGTSLSATFVPLAGNVTMTGDLGMTGIDDTNGNNILALSATTSADSYLQVSNTYASSNMLLQSNGFSTAPWSLSGGATLAQNLVSPNGTLNSGWTVSDVSAGTADTVLQIVAITAIPHTFSIYVAKTVGATTFPVMWALIGNTIGIATIDTNNGVATAWTAYTGCAILGGVSATCVSHDANWWRVALTFTGTDASYTFRFAPTATTNATQSTGVIDSSLTGSAGIAWAQLEPRSTATTYNPTTTTAYAQATNMALTAISAATNQSISIIPKGTGQVLLPTGLAATPSIGFAAHPNTGFWDDGTGAMFLSVLGTVRASFGSTYFYLATTLGLRFTGTVTPGIYDSNANGLLKFNSAASAVNEFTITNAATATAPTLSATGDDTNISMNFVSKGTGVSKFYSTTNGTTPLQVLGDANQAYLTFATSSGVVNAYIGANTANQFIILNTTGSKIIFAVDTGVVGVNYLKFFSSLTTAPTIIQAIGTDTNIGIDYINKGTGVHRFKNLSTGAVMRLWGSGGSSATIQFNGGVGETLYGYLGMQAGLAIITNPSSSKYAMTIGVPAAGTPTTNYPAISFGTAGNPVTFSALGDDTNISINLTPKGVGGIGVNTTAPRGLFDVLGGTAAATVGGNDILLTAQTAGAGNADGGSILLFPGVSTGTGVKGIVAIGFTQAELTASWYSANLLYSKGAAFFIDGYISGNGTGFNWGTSSAGMNGQGNSNNTDYVLYKTVYQNRLMISAYGDVSVGASYGSRSFQVIQPTTYSSGTYGARVTNTAGSGAITGTDTRFLNWFKVGDTITINGDTHTILSIASDTAMTTYGFVGANTLAAFTLAGGTRFVVSGNGLVGVGVLTPTALLHIAAGTASTAPLKFTSGTNLTTAEAGAIEFTTDDFFATITTGAARKAFILDDGARLTSGKVPVATTNGRLVDSAGVSGSFTTADLKTVTVTNGLITAIV